MTNFKLSKFYFYIEPNYYLNKPACAFNIYISKNLLLKNSEEKVFELFQHITNKKLPDVVNLFAEVLISVLKMNIDLSIGNYNISTNGDEYVIAVEYSDKETTKACAKTVSKWFQAIEHDEQSPMIQQFESLQNCFDKSFFSKPTLYSLIETSIKLNVPIFLYEENLISMGIRSKTTSGSFQNFLYR